VYSGATTQLWQARHEGEHQYYAVKVLLPQFRGSREHLAYLRREYEVGRQLEHPRIIRVFAIQLRGPAAYLVMEWFPAPSMRSWIQRGLEELMPHLSQIVFQAAEALAHVHERGWVHRDVKPDNFLVSNSGEVKLIDFALARRRPGWLQRLLPGRSRIQGTQSYMSPEQIRGQLVDPRSDVYSLACTYYHLLGKQPPFTAPTTAELLHKHLRAIPPSLTRLNPRVHPEFAELVGRMLAKNPADRPASAAEVVAELRRIPVFRDQ
jgi:serine/threonine protein kinase